MVFADFDYDNFPIVIVNFYENPIDEGEFQEYMDELNCLLTCCGEKQSKCCLIFNCIEMSESISLTYAKKQASYLKKNKNLIEQGLCASSIIGPKWVKAVLKIIFTISPPVKPFFVTRKLDKGMRFIEGYKQIPSVIIDKDLIIDSLAAENLAS